MPENKECSSASSCSKESCEGCSGSQQESFAADMNQYSSIKKVIGVVSGKGGVGKSFVTAGLAAKMRKKGYEVGILDADITGPSIPKMFGVHGPAVGNDMGIDPIQAEDGTKIMSINLLMDDEEAPVVWRGPVIAGAVKQFWTDVIWGDVDYMFIDCPPGTGDVPLTVFQSIKLDGVVIVTTPQDLVSMIVGKAVHMANMMNIPIIGLVENMSYVKCPDCGRELHVFGQSKAEDVCKEYGIELLGRMPIDEKLSSLVDHGVIELMDNDYLDHAADCLEKFCEKN